MDLLVGLRGLEAEAFSRAIDVPFMGAVLRVARREDFIAMKVFAGGPQNLSNDGSSFLTGVARMISHLHQGARARDGSDEWPTDSSP